MQLVRVKSHSTKKQFLQVPHLLYKNDPNWIAPLHDDIEAVFSPNKNPVYKNGHVVRWILLDKNGKLIGRIAAFLNHKALLNMEHPIGGIGFFECIDDEAAAFKLFDVSREWLERRGMKGMDGPINFGERDRFWGLLVEGFDPPSYMENYNPPYYRRFFENYGFRLYFEQITYHLRSDKYDPTRLNKIAQWVMRKPEYSFRHLNMAELDKFAKDFVEIYNAGWQKFENFKPVKPKEIIAIFKSMKAIIIPEYIWFAYVNDAPAAFIVMLPDANQLFKYINGKMNLFNKLKLLYYKYTRRMHKLKGLVFGIHPDYQNHGLDAAIVHKFYDEVAKTWQYTEVGISWIGGFNPKMHSLMKALKGDVYKVHHTYRKLFDPTIEFKPYSLQENNSK